jgi:hypothetical protein
VFVGRAGPEEGRALPSHGERWAVIRSAGAGAPRSPAQGFRLRELAADTGWIAQEFPFDPAHPLLAFEVALERSGPSADDVLSIDLSDGMTSQNLWRSQANAARHIGRTRLVVERVVRDLGALFPAADASTRFTLWIQVGEGGDGVPSFGHVDGFRLTPRVESRAGEGGAIRTRRRGFESLLELLRGF